MDVRKFVKYVLYFFDVVMIEQFVWMDYDCENEYSGDDKFLVFVFDKRIEEISVNVFDDVQDDVCDYCVQDIVEIIENGNCQIFEK